MLPSPLPRSNWLNQRTRRKVSACFTHRCGWRGLHCISLLITEAKRISSQQKLPTTPHPQPYNIGWLSQGWDLHVSQQCHLPYAIKPFKDEVLCDVAPLEVCDVLLGQPYMWKCHAMYESRPRTVIITLGKRLYKIPEVAPKASISLISAKQCTKVIT